MFKLLIVDDEIQAVNNIKEALNWEKIGINQVYTANSMRQAKEVFVTHEDINIMLCDIEMPQGNGLELFKWVKEHYFHVENIFLTCHADFKYAKEAISLGSFDYLLKPVPFLELENIIKKVIEKIKIKQRDEEYNKYGQNWVANQNRIMEQFWFDIITGKISADIKEITSTAQLRKIDFEKNHVYLPILISMYDLSSHLKTWNEGILEFTFKNIAAEIILENETAPQIVATNDRRLVVLAQAKQGSELDVDKFLGYCELFIKECKKYFGCHLFCYIGEYVKIDQLSNMFRLLVNLEENNVLNDHKVVRLKTSSRQIISYVRPNMELWVILLSEGKKSQLQAEILNYLDTLIKARSIDANILNQFCLDFMQAMFFVLTQKGIQANLLFKDNEVKTFYFEASQSVQNTKMWTNQILEKAINYFNMVEASVPVVDKVKLYITKNLHREISREDLSQHVYLNPDYLTRLFKKETGQSLSDFILDERMKTAQELLKKTDLTVKDIAVKMSYSNFSHFSKMFKKYCGVNPVEYRKR